MSLADICINQYHLFYVYGENLMPIITSVIMDKVNGDTEQKQ